MNNQNELFPYNNYEKSLDHPEWQKMRLKVFERDDWTCRRCGDKQTRLEAHHRWYPNKNPNFKPWLYPEEDLLTLCRPCHQDETDKMKPNVQALNIAIKKKFMADEIILLRKAFEILKLNHNPNDVAKAIYKLFITEHCMDKIVDKVRTSETNCST